MLICPLARTFIFREQLIFKLRELNHNVVLLSEAGPEMKKFIAAGCVFEEIHMDRRGKSLFNDGKLLKDYYKTIKRIQPDAVLLYTTKCSVYGGMVCRLLKIPYIVNNAGLIESKGILSVFLNVLYRIGFSGASCMMYQNDQEQKVVQSVLKNKTHFRRIPGSGVDLNIYQYSEYPENNEEIIFNYVARVMKSKGIEEYLECAKQVHQAYPKTRFRIYGTFDDNKYKQIVEEYEKAGYVEYCGQKTDMKPEIASSSAAIHPSYYEGMTNVVLEHSAMGRPCIGSNIPGVKEGISHGETGFLFHVRDVSSLVRVVNQFIELPLNQKKEMGKKARLKMENEFDRTIVTDVYIQEIERLLN